MYTSSLRRAHLAELIAEIARRSHIRSRGSVRAQGAAIEQTWT